MSHWDYNVGFLFQPGCNVQGSPPVVALPQPLAYQDTKRQLRGANPTAKNRHVQMGWRDPII